MRGKWKQLELEAREAKECCKLSLMGLSEKMLQSKDPREKQKLKIQHISFQSDKNLAALCQCLKNLNELPRPK